MNKHEEYEDLKLDFCSEYANPNNSVGEDCALLVNQIKITMALFADKALLSLWIKRLKKEIKKIAKDIDSLNTWKFD